MAITIPDNTALRLTTDFAINGGQRIPANAGAALTNPGPVAVKTTQNSPDGKTLVIQAAGDAGRAGYLGFNMDHDVPSGKAASVIRRVMIEGFAGMTPGSELYIDASGADASGTASGLTHTLPTTGNVRTPIGVACTATKAYFF